MKSKNPNSGIYEANTSRTLDVGGANPACNQGGVVVLEGNGTRESHKGDGYAESDTMYTLNTIERHAVCIGNGQAEQTKIQEKVGTLNCMHDQQAIMTYGIDRAAFNQGKNAQYDFSVIEDQAQTIVARGPGGGIYQTVGSLCARDYKGVGNQYVQEGKVIVQQRCSIRTEGERLQGRNRSCMRGS